MTASEAKKSIVVNIAFWMVAMLLHPMTRLLPTSSGNPPKILELMIPLFFVMLAGGSTYLLKTAIGKTKGI